MTTRMKSLLLCAAMSTALACSKQTQTPTAPATEDQAMSNEDIVRTFLSGFNDPSKIQASLDLLAEDYKFKNPMVELNSKAEFIPLAESIGATLTGVDVLHVAQAGEWVAAYYVFKSEIPGVEVNPATEWFRVDNGMIKESHLVYDASQWRKVYAAMEAS